jgi:hypothetical protein
MNCELSRPGPFGIGLILVIQENLKYTLPRPRTLRTKFQGPTGNKHILQTAGGMWNLQLEGRLIS